MIAIAINMMYARDGTRQLHGGAMRWCLDLARLVVNTGQPVTVFQKADRAFETELIPGARLVGIPAAESIRGSAPFEAALARRIGLDNPVIFVSQELGALLPWKNAAGINHGIWWDGDYPRPKKIIIEALHSRLVHRHRVTICVDTAYINWVHSTVPGRASYRDRLVYIPNYAGNEFVEARPTPRLPTREGELKILFPRRTAGANLLEQGRGLGLFLQTLKRLKQMGLPFHACICGRGNLQSASEEFAREHGFASQVDIIDVGFDEMPGVVAWSDVVVVPSLEHEGTSLSAVEGLAAGKYVVVTHIGGLGNIVIDHLNGRVVSPTVDALAEAIAEATSWETTGTELQKRQVAALGKDRWNREVLKALTPVLGGQG